MVGESPRLWLLLLLAVVAATAPGPAAGGGGGAGAGDSSPTLRDELQDGRYGSRTEGLYKWQRNRDAVRSKALQSKAKRLGISVAEVEAMEKEVVSGDDPRKKGGGGGDIEADYGKRSGQYAWQRNKDEVRRKGEEAKQARMMGNAQRQQGEGVAAEAEAAEGGEGATAADFEASQAALDAAEHVRVRLLKKVIGKSWYQEPRLCDPGERVGLHCEEPEVVRETVAIEAPCSPFCQ
jgi:hypothetical protein